MRTSRRTWSFFTKLAITQERKKMYSKNLWNYFLKIFFWMDFLNGGKFYGTLFPLHRVKWGKSSSGARVSFEVFELNSNYFFRVSRLFEAFLKKSLSLQKLWKLINISKSYDKMLVFDQKIVICDGPSNAWNGIVMKSNSIFYFGA